MERLLQHVRDGKVRIPDFQRPLRWRASHVIDFLDSVYRGFPVGELLIAKQAAEPKTLHFGPLRIDAPHVAEAYFVVDGQQRVTALAGAMLHPEQRPRADIHAVWFDLEKECFVRLQAAEPPPHWIPVNVVADSFVLLNWLKDWPFSYARPDLVQRAIALSKALREYEIPAYIVEGASEDVLSLIFKRANTSGVAMRESEVFEALFGGSGPRPIESACDRLQSETGFGKVSGDWFLRCLKVVERLDLRQTFTAREDDAGVLRPEAVEHTESALRRAISFLSDDAGILHTQLLPYSLPLVVLARFFHLHPHPAPRTRALLVRWTWRGALSGVHTDSSDASVHGLQSQIDHDEFSSVERLLRTVPGKSEFPAASTRWYGQAAKVRLCAIAMAHLAPRDPETGEALRFDALQALLDRKPIGEVFLDVSGKGDSTVARRILLPKRRKIRSLPSASAEVLQSHGLDREAAAALACGDLVAFALLRARILDPFFQRFFTGRSAPDDSDRPPIAELARRVDARLAAT